MNDDGLTGQERPEAGGYQSYGGEALLRAEIGFWRELLRDGADRLPAESLERARQALGLAEYKLQLWFKRHLQASGSTGCPGRTSDDDVGSVH
jgi:hypothetical protein